MGRIFENRRLMTHKEAWGLLDNRQFVFHPNKSTDDYLTHLEFINSHLERGKHSDAVSLDLSKAYDRAWRFPILKSLEEWGIKGRMGMYKAFWRENGFPDRSVIAPTHDSMLSAEKSQLLQISSNKKKVNKWPDIAPNHSNIIPAQHRQFSAAPSFGHTVNLARQTGYGIIECWLAGDFINSSLLRVANIIQFFDMPLAHS